MPRQPMEVTHEDFKKVETAINDVKEEGRQIRSIFEGYSDENFGIDWEVDAAQDGQSRYLQPFTSPERGDSMRCVNYCVE